MFYIFHPRLQIGVAIQQDGIYMVQLKKKNNTWYCFYRTHYIFKKSIFVDSQIDDWATLKMYLQQFSESESLKDKMIVMNFPTGLVYMQQMVLPPDLSEDEIESEIVLRLQQISPHLTETWRIDFEVLSAEAHQQSIIFIATSERYLLQYLQFIQSIGLNIKVVDFDRLALRRAVEDRFPDVKVDLWTDLSSFLFKDPYLLAHGLAMRG